MTFSFKVEYYKGYDIRRYPGMKEGRLHPYVIEGPGIHDLCADSYIHAIDIIDAYLKVRKCENAL